MKSLLLLLVRQRNFLFFVFLEIIAGALIVSANNFQRSKFISLSNGFTGHLLTLTSDIGDYFSLKAQNDALLVENQQLRNRLSSSFLDRDSLTTAVLDTIYRQRYRYQKVKILRNSFQKRNNYLMLSKGAAQGVYPEMGLITNDGVLGIVNKVSENFSTALSILHSKVSIDAKLKSSSYRGTVSWDGRDYREGSMENVPAHAPLHQGDTVITSGNSAIFPAGIMVGTVKSFDVREGEGFYHITIDYSVDYNKVHYAYLISNLMKEEQDSLIKEVEHE